MVQQPRVVADRYRLVQQLGQGGMGRVWLAHDDWLHRDVAIKEIVPPAGLAAVEREEMRERTLREARAIARLTHPNVVRIFDVLTYDGDPWIVMEYVQGRSLQQVLAQDGPLPVPQVAEIGLGVLGALRAAHRAGVLHRDVKPGNVLLAENGRVVLTDFGLATVPDDPVLTRTGLVLGSPAYIAPERARDGTAGPESDLWSLGATLFAAVEGKSPYARTSALATLTALATEPPTPARRAGQLRPVLNGLLRKNPADRLSRKETERLLLRAAGRRTGTVPGRVAIPGLRRGRRPGQATGAAPEPKGPEAVSSQDRPPRPPESALAATVDDPARLPDALEPARQDRVESPPTTVLSPADADAGIAEDRAPVVPGPRKPESPVASFAEPPAVSFTEPPAVPAAAPLRVPAALPAAQTPAPRPALALRIATLHQRFKTHWRFKTHRWGVAAVGVILVLIVALVVVVIAARGGDQEDERGAASVSSSADAGGAGAAVPSPSVTGTAEPSSTPSTGASPTPTAGGDLVLPSGWHWHTDQTGFKVAVPSDWNVSRKGTIVYFREPGGSRLLLIDQTTKPKDDPVADWTRQEGNRLRAGDWKDYQRVGIKAVDYFVTAADWEFTYTSASSGRRVHVVNRGFVTSPKQAYAIYWSTPDSQWSANLDNFRLIAQSFQPRS